MYVKTFTGSSTSAILADIKAELGPEAVILDTRESEKDGKTEIVITAALERDATAAPAAQQAPGARDLRANAAIPYGMGWKSWQDEWALIKSHLLTLMRPEMQLGRLTPRQRVVMEYLEREGVDATALLAFFEVLAADPQTPIFSALERQVPVRGWGLANWPQKVHLFAGPFGAGKTTALVRMALLLRKEAPSRRIWVINADSQRGGGRLLLKNYAQLCGLEYREACNAMEFAGILSAARVDGVETILVDLPGVPRGKTLAQLLAYFGMNNTDNALHLVISPHEGQAAEQALPTRYIPGFRGMEASLIWTKLDEAEKYGTLVNVASASGLPTCAFSCGAELNGTLVAAESNALWRLLFKQELPCPVQAEGHFY